MVEQYRVEDDAPWAEREGAGRAGRWATLAPAARPPTIRTSYADCVLMTRSTKPGCASDHAGADFRIASWITSPSCHSGSTWRCSNIRRYSAFISGLSAFFL